MKSKLLSIIAAAVLFSSCQKENVNVDSKVGKKLSEIDVPASFDWRTTSDINISVGVSDSRFGNSLHVISVYTQTPASGVEPISVGSATVTTPFNTKISLPKVLSELYVVKSAPDGTQVSGKVAVSTSLNVTVTDSEVLSAIPGLKSSAKQVNAIASTLNEPEPNCSSATRTISSNGNAGDINSGQVVAITANGANVSFNNLNGGTLLICATNVSISGINLNGTTVVVTSSGSANISNVNFNSSSSKIKNFGTLTINGNLTNQGEIANYGVLKLNHSLYSNNNPKFINTGSVTIESGSTIAGYFNNSGTITIKSGESSFNASQSSFNSGTILVDASKLNVSGAITNTGTIQARELNFTGSSDIKNHCKMISTTSIIIDAKVINYSFISAGTHTDLRAHLQLEAGSIYKTKSVNTFDRTVLGSSTNPGLFKSEQAIAANVNANPAFSGKLSVCGAEAMATSKFTNGAVKDCNLYIPANNCTEGNGTAPKPVVKDTDGDGVADDLDAFPTDATKAFKHYSLNYANHGSSVAFEDNWPYKGDYDLNDIVLTYRYMIVTNSQNKVVRIEADYKLLATGGAFRNGAGVQFNIPSTSAKNFTGPQGTYLENGQDSIVVILFENSRNEQPTWNTDLSQAASEVKQYSIGFDIENGPLISVLGIGVYNPFIWNSTSGYGRGFETHLLGKAPTKKADISLFGTGDDNSVVGRKYSTKDNLPYALEIPTAPFEYPLERVAITDAYLNFADWASSAGATAEEWYNQVEGYVNRSLIYSR